MSAIHRPAGIDWLAGAADAVNITELALPGTHDTMTASCGLEYYKTQDLSLEEQWAIGVRFLDLRITRELLAAHREWTSTIAFGQIIDTLREFLRAQPSEFVIVRLQNANERKDDYDRYAAAIRTVLSANRDLFLPLPANDSAAWPNLGQARGKLLGLECSPTELGLTTVDGQSWAANWHDNPAVLVQDEWNGPPLELKQDAIGQLVLAPPPAATRGTLNINHISATNGDLGTPLAYAERLNPFALDLMRQAAE
ncbi:MAG: hypothetical protein LBI99_11020, partial [Propionibacteriaceae bacterium]|nr:hypothetical protein [Propionibacteriaceae bacterium]